MVWVIIFLYSFSLLLITVFSLGQLNLTFHYLKKNSEKKDFNTLEKLPKVTIQLPVFNEKYVVERLIKSVIELDYPRELLEIQVLDDSTDETISIIDQVVEKYMSEGHNIKTLRRKNRLGFKAGALQYGLENAEGDFIAIFDADFLPKSDFLLKTIPFFSNEKVGLIQTRWEHLNKDYSLLTKMQAFGLDAHFSIEQSGRNKAGSFINFNGTAGVWRKTCISDAGGWQFDTLTEDLDLSYRAQLKGWEFKYLQEIGSPAELPVVVPAIKSQQYRWNKGAAETARKILGDVIKSDISGKNKIRAVLHLLNSTVFVFLMIAAVLSIPMLYLKDSNPALSLIFDLGSVFIIGFIAIAIFYWYSSKSVAPKSTFRYYILNFPLFLSFSMGMALHNSIAIIEGFIGRKTPFIRTPKFNVINAKDKWQGNIYLKSNLTPITIIEGLLCIYFLFGIGLGFFLQDYGLVLFHFMLAFGFGLVFYQSLKSVKHAI